MAKRILLVEDEEFISQMYQTALTNQGYTVDLAMDGEVALTKLSDLQNAYDLIILDIMLPKTDGLSILQKIKQPASPYNKTPVFLLTNLGLDHVVKQAMELGANKYFVKSNFLPKDIVHEVETFFSLT